MIYNWTLSLTVNANFNDKDYLFSESDNPYDLTEIIEENWIKDCIARGYFVKDTSKNTSKKSSKEKTAIDDNG